MSITKSARPFASAKQQRGMSMLESLIALLVLALGIMGLAGVQTRMIVENRTSNNRAMAISLIDDLTNRMLFNRDGAYAGSYALAWSATKAAKDCVTATCTAAELAQSDLNLWRAAVTTALPGANATVFSSSLDGRQLGIAISWAANESASADASSTAYNLPFAITGTTCPDNSICHLVYVRP